jgi:hypothetical protein
MMNPTIDSLTAQGIADREIGYRVMDAEGAWEYVARQDEGDSRWHHNYLMVLRDEEGKNWGLRYRIGLTEEQENECPWDGYEERLTLTRLHPHTVTTTVYKTESAEVTA